MLPDKIESAPASSLLWTARANTIGKHCRTYRFHATKESFHAFVDEFKQPHE